MIPFGDEYRPAIYTYLNKSGAAHMRRTLGEKGVPVQTWRVTQPSPGGGYQIVRDPDHAVGQISQAELLALGVPPSVLGAIVRRFIAASFAREKTRWTSRAGNSAEEWFHSETYGQVRLAVHEIVSPLLRELIPLNPDSPQS
jgi:hypothetical protein